MPAHPLPLRCAGYLNPFCQYSEQGSKWSCNLCGMLNETRGDHYCPLGFDGRRNDRETRPELSRGTVDCDKDPQIQYGHHCGDLITQLCETTIVMFQLHPQIVEIFRTTYLSLPGRPFRRRDRRVHGPAAAAARVPLRD